MKKLILILLLISSMAYGQFDLTANQSNGKFSLATNNTTLMGVTSGNIVIPVNFTVSDTSSNWTLLANQTNGKYSVITNAVPFMGKSAGTVQIPVTFNLGSSSSTDTSLFVKRSAFSQSITATGGDMSFDGATTIDFTAPSGVTFNSSDGDFEVSVVEGAIELTSTNGGIYLNGINSQINIVSGGNISFEITDNTSNFVGFTGNKTSVGGVTPASNNLYLHVQVDGVEYKIPLITP